MKMKLSESQQKLVDLMLNQKLYMKLRKMTGFHDSFSFAKLESGGHYSGGHISTNTVKALIKLGVLVEFENYENYIVKYKLSETFLKSINNE